MMQDIPWSLETCPSEDTEKANDLAAEGWQPFAVDAGIIYFKRVGTSADRLKVQACCGNCKHFTMQRSGTAEKPAAGFCDVSKCSTNEMYYCDEYETVYGSE